MSWYTTYYAGYRNKDDGKVYFLGPYDKDGEPYCLMSLSRSFTSDLKQSFYPLDKEEIGEGLLEAIGREYEEDDEVDEFYKQLRSYIGYLPVQKLGSSDYIKKAYCLKSDIDEYEKNEGSDFYHQLTPQQYIRKLEAELKFGEEKPKVDEEGYEYQTHSCRDYSFYAYPEYVSREYEAFRLKLLMSVFDSYTYGKDNIELVVIKTEG